MAYSTEDRLAMLDEGYIKRLHVSQPNIRKNLKEGTNEPVLTIQTSKGPVYGHRVKINGESELVYSPNKPLSCGARVYIETTSEIEIVE